MAELTKKAIIEAMNEAYKKNGYYGACKVYEEMRLPYPADQTKELVKKVENTFVGTIAEIKAKVEETKAEAKKPAQRLCGSLKVTLRKYVIHLSILPL